MAELTDVQKWVRERCPTFVIYGPSNVGKTTLLATLMEDDDYWPALFIDGDDGDITIAKYTNVPKICDYRSKSKRPLNDSVFKWFGSTMMEARKSKHKAIIIEGFTRFRDDRVSKFLLDNPGQIDKSRGLQQAYIGPSVLSGALYGAVSEIQDYRKRAGTGCPIIVTLNAKTADIDDDETLVPNLSGNLTRNLMRRVDAFVEMVRPANMPTQLKTTKSAKNPFRKVRNPVVAKALANMRNPNLPDLLELWAQTELEQTRKMAALAADDEDTSDQDNDTENGTT